MPLLHLQRHRKKRHQRREAPKRDGTCGKQGEAACVAGIPGAAEGDPQGSAKGTVAVATHDRTSRVPAGRRAHATRRVSTNIVAIVAALFGPTTL